jgi:hypothetical protein
MSTRTDESARSNLQLHNLTAEALKADKAANAAKEKARGAKSRLKVAKREFKAAKSDLKAAKKSSRKAAKEAKRAQKALQVRLDRIAKHKKRRRSKSVKARAVSEKSAVPAENREPMPLPPAANSA